MRILIVDDEPELVEQIRQALAKQKYTVDTALDGEEAMDRIYVDPYDLILLDIMLPKKDGFVVLLELRNEKKSTPVLMLTAKGSIDDRIKGLDLGADDYLAKPFSMEELLARIRALPLKKNGTGYNISAAILSGTAVLDYRTEKSRASTSGGFGLGLTIVKRIVELHHGRIKLEGEFRSWVQFYVVLPVMES